LWIYIGGKSSREPKYERVHTSRNESGEESSSSIEKDVSLSEKRKGVKSGKLTRKFGSHKRKVDLKRRKV